MKISPIPSGANMAPNPTETPSATVGLRSLRMNTNANPSFMEQTIRPNPQVQDLPGIQRPANIESIDDQADNPEATGPISPQFAALAKQRRSLQVKERELTEREKALSNPTADQDSISKARLLEKPLDVLLEAGVTYEQLTEAILANQGNSEINSLKAELEDLRKGVDQKLTDRDAQAERQVLAEMRKEAEQLVAEGEDFELVRGMGKIPDVMKLIERTYRESGEVLDVKEALGLVEKELLAEAEKIAGYKKVRSQFIPQTPQMQRHQGMRTLTNRDTASVPMSAKQRALAAFHGTLTR